MKKYLAVGLAGLTAVSLAACGSTVTKIETVTTSSARASTPDPATTPDATTDPATTPDTTPSSDNLTGPIGTAFSDTDAENNKMGVKLTHVIDPAKGGDEFTTPDNGKRFVGAKFTITGMSGHYSDDANSDAVIIGSDGQTYSPDFDDIQGCTNFNEGSFSVSPGQSLNGCVVFQVPQSVKVASIQWGGEFGGNPATWTVS